MEAHAKELLVFDSKHVEHELLNIEILRPIFLNYNLQGFIWTVSTSYDDDETWELLVTLGEDLGIPIEEISNHYCVAWTRAIGIVRSAIKNAGRPTAPADDIEFIRPGVIGAVYL